MSIPHQLTDQVKLLQKVAIIRSNKTELEVLLLQRSPEALSRPNCWDLPGGNSEWPEENLSQANLHLQDLSREVKEETALQFAPAILKNQLPVHFSTYFDGEKQIFTVICGWSLDFDSTNQAEIQLSAEHQAYAWVNAKSLTDCDFGGEQGAFVLDTIQQAFLNFKKLS